MSDVAFACRLDVFDSADRRRYGVLRTEMQAAVQEVKTLSDGYALRLRPEADLFRDVAEWITLERRCCPFLGLGLEWSDADAVWVRLTGGPGVRSFLAEALGRTLAA
jgi:hypothetical protein